MKKDKVNQTSIVSETINNKFLIHFDFKTKLTIAILAMLYVFFVAFKLNFSSIGVWDMMTSNSKPKSVIWGSPQGIRSDEWVTASTMLMSQITHGLQQQNEIIGGEKSPLLMNTPVNHFSNLFRIPLWGFFVLDVERGFSFHWAFKTIGSVFGVFLLLLLFTKNNFWVSLLGSIIVFSSSASQYWLSGLVSECAFCTSMLIVSFIYVLYATKPWIILANLLVILFFGLYFFLILYPPLQIPCIWFMLFAIIGWIWQNYSIKIWENKLLKISGLAFVLVFALGFIFYFFNEISSTVEVMTSTVYPGKRSVTGGTGFKSALFSEFLIHYIKPEKIPSTWDNICEASNFLMFFPVVIGLLVFQYFQTKKIDKLALFLGLNILLLNIWIFIGFPSFIAKLTLLNLSPAYRTSNILGHVNLILTFVFIGNQNIKEKDNWYVIVIVAIISFFFIYLNLTSINKDALLFFKSGQIINMTLLFTLLYTLIYLSNRGQVYQLIFLGIVVIYNFSILKFNPLNKGMDALLKNPLLIDAKNINKTDPDAKWVVFGNPSLPNLFKAAGLNVINGVNYIPNWERLKILDPEKKQDTVYNRFAHIGYYSSNINSENVDFRYGAFDAYSVLIDPCNQKLEKIGVKYYVFTYNPQPAEVRCMELVSSNGVLIYKKITSK